MSTVSVPGSDGSTLTLYMDYPAYAALAQQLLAGRTADLITAPGTYAIAGDTTAVGASNGSGTNPVPGLRFAPMAPANGPVVLTDSSTASDQLLVIGAGYDVSFTSTTGEGTIIGGAGADTFSVGDGNWNIETSASGSTVTAGNGNDTITMGGSDSVTLGSGEDLVFGVASGGTVNGGTGDLFYVAGPSTATTINGGTGMTIAFGAPGSDTTFNGSGSGFFVAGGGSETVDASGSTGNNAFFASQGDASLVGGSGNDFLAAGNGNSTLTGGDGSNLFAFYNHADSTSQDTVTDFSATDYVDIVGSTYTESTDSSGDLQLALSDGTKITFTGITSIDSSHITTG